jgi:hypothetical protein
MTAALALTGTVTLDGEGDPGAVFIFLGDADFDTAAGSTVSLVGGAQPANVFWVVAGAIGTGANSSMSGALLSRGAITLGDGTAVTGQALSRGTVTLAGNSLTGVAPAPSALMAPAQEPQVESAEPEASPVLLGPPDVPEPAPSSAQPDVSETPDETVPSEGVVAPDPGEPDPVARDPADEAIQDEATVTP